MTTQNRMYIDDGLSPCPLCNSDDLRFESYGIECRNCGLWLSDGTQVRRVFGSVTKAWNTRIKTDHRI